MIYIVKKEKKVVKYYVYQLINSLTNEIFYIGKGSGKRCFKHIVIAKNNHRNKSKNPKLYNKIDKIISLNGEVIVEKIFHTDDEILALEYEKDIIAKIGLENLCNLTIGGDGTSYTNGFTLDHKINIIKSRLSNKLGRVLSEDEIENVKNNILKPCKRKTKYTKGSSLPEDVKENMSKSHTGKTFTIEHKHNLSQSLKGRELSEEHKKNLSIANKKPKTNLSYEFIAYDDAKKWILENVKINSKSEWMNYAKDSLYPNFMPKSPYSYYQNKGWVSWNDFLGK